jgi:hypothetical protein
MPQIRSDCVFQQGDARMKNVAEQIPIEDFPALSPRNGIRLKAVSGKSLNAAKACETNFAGAL